ncbi:MAG: hypothetical protein ACP5JG_19340, partial [Anaerolineae bacterium]
MMINHSLRDKLVALGEALIDQERARVVVEPQERASGFWFGGGNLVEAPDGTFYLSGRYRNYGDSRTGLGAGTRGWALVILASHDRGKTFEKVVSFAKADLDLEDKPVLSIEGSALHFTQDGVELFVSSEKDNAFYPPAVRSFQKPNTGIWSIERLRASSVPGLASAEVEPLLASRDPRFIHVKDPLVYEQQNGELVLGFCTHPFNWTSSNSGYMVRAADGAEFGEADFEFFRRGFTWDVAITRMTGVLRVPQVGAFASKQPLTLVFYDGGESMRAYEEHAQAVKRPRGYSCEEIGGLAFAPEGRLDAIERLSVNLPMFVSPVGTGCSRYVDVLATEEGFYATWEQSQEDRSQPLVMNFLSREEVESILT